MSEEERDVALEASAIRDGVRDNKDEWEAVDIEFRFPPLRGISRYEIDVEGERRRKDWC